MNMEEQLEKQKEENIALKANMEVLETALVEEKKIHEKNITSLEQKYQKEIAQLKIKVPVLEMTNIEHVKNIASLEEKYQKEIAELKGKLTEQKEVFEEKLKKLEEVIHANQQKISEAEDEIMMAIHEMKVQLPLENWHDLLAFIPRRQLGNAVSQNGDRQFTRIIQSFLHDEVRKITLGKMTIIAPHRPMEINPPLHFTFDHPAVHVMPMPNTTTTTNMPDWPMPGNIKDFKEIVLNYVDASVLRFLGYFQQNSLLTDVNMYIDGNWSICPDILPRVLTKIVPFITSIDSIESRSPGIELFNMVYNNDSTNLGSINESQLLLKEMMAKTRILLIRWYVYRSESLWKDNMDWFCSWLYTPRNDMKPRMLRLFDGIYDATNQCSSFIERIKKDFKMANHPASFFICTSTYPEDVEDISIDNDKTNEKLVIKIANHGNEEKLLISRYPLKALKNWIEANENEITQWNGETLDRKITLQNGLTIGI